MAPATSTLDLAMIRAHSFVAPAGTVMIDLPCFNHCSRVVVTLKNHCYCKRSSPKSIKKDQYLVLSEFISLNLQLEYL